MEEGRDFEYDYDAVYLALVVNWVEAGLDEAMARAAAMTQMYTQDWKDSAAGMTDWRVSRRAWA